MTATRPEIDPSRLEGRLAGLSGIERVRQAAAAADLAAFLVGGAVRDLLLGAGRTDVDVVVEGDVAPLAADLGGTVRSHERFGTASVQLDGAVVDLARARQESYPRPGALPEVRPASLAEDLARRDFTVNAMALPLTRTPELIDPHHGVEDLRAGRLRVLHPGSFRDDPTRALRAARYAARLDLALEPRTAELLADADLETVSRERREAELRRLAAEPEAARGLAFLADWGLLDLAPERIELVGRVIALMGRPEWDAVADRAEAVLGASTGDPGRPRALAGVSPARPSAAVEAAHGHTGAELAVARALGADWLDRYVSEWRDVRLEVGGADLLAAGVAQGPAVGQGLAAALRAKLDGEVSGHEDELRVALAAARADEATAEAQP